jgi:hypothetical protein
MSPKIPIMVVHLTDYPVSKNAQKEGVALRISLPAMDEASAGNR